MKLKQVIEGSVCIRAKGTQIGRFLSVLAARAILYENVVYETNGIMLEIPARRFKEAVVCGKKTGMKVRIQSKKGMPFWVFRQRRKKWTLLLVLPMVLLTFYLPCFIWSIEVEGLENISQVEMLIRLEELGVRKGVRQNKISLENVKNELLLIHDDLSFLSLAMEGSTLNVRVEEAVDPPEAVERIEPCDLVAEETCVIYSIITEQGTPLVQAGDVVQAGDILISGEVIQKNDDGSEKRIETHASGEVYGKMSWMSEAEIEKNYVNKVYFSENNKGFRINTGIKSYEIRWPFSQNENESIIEKEVWRSSLNGNISISKLLYAGYEYQNAEYTEDEMEAKLKEKLSQKLTNEMEEGEKIILKENFTMQQTNTGMRAILEAEIMENIGVTVPRVLSEVEE